MGDFNKDNHTHFVVASYGTKTVDILLGNGDGTFAFQISYGNGLSLGAFVVAAGDFNSDGQSEIDPYEYCVIKFKLTLSTIVVWKSCLTSL
ncbi:unnamed protein product [Rotaria magnacalcarata]|uniref:Uncharacterized protein n=2 Tax=Rotaria magnacalcarata TaxID=392030 RepID=A0A820BET8_9BILA|nr:unnamed protein product [Rotaria magnacalcarata]